MLRCVRFVRGLATLPVLLGILLAFHSTGAQSQLPPLIPREALFGEPERIMPTLSSDGSRIVWLERAPWGALRPRVVTLGSRDTISFLDERDGFDFVEWAGNGYTLLTLRQREGDENWHLWALDTRTKQMRDLTPFPKVRAEEFFTHPRHPNEVLVALNRRDPRVFDLWRVNLTTGEARFDTRNPGDIVTWTMDPDFQVRAAVALDPKTSDTRILYRDRGDTTWKEHQRWPFKVAGMDRDRRIIGFRQDGNAVYLQNGIGTNTSRIVESELGTSRERVVVPHHPQADLWNQGKFTGSEGYCTVLLDPRNGRPLAAAINELKPSWFAVDSSVAPDLRLLGSRHGGVFEILSTDTLDRRWVVCWERDTGSSLFELYDRRTRRLTPLFEANPPIARLPLVPIEGFYATARDGRKIPCYLAKPKGVAAKHLPMVVVPHGGPWYRDEWGYMPDVQWLANRGYAVLLPQFRGSTGFGVDWLNAGDHEFGDGKVLGDIVDAAQWVARQGVADSTRMAIMGGSFGGYAALCALAFAPERFRCGVDFVGPSDLAHLISGFPSYWEARRRRWLNRMGEVIADRALNRRLSPLYHADAITAPLLVAHGANDPRCKLEASERIVKVLRDRKREVTFLVYPDEGHGFSRIENQRDYSARVEEFLARHLGGRAIPRADVPGSSVQVR
ncbi:MAG TPA: prolyl oligopeptidase family serine peptidase [Candidatus Eisenbacteria bacterium]|nr:prolyl oligopeptidase family serine peptidase [Candidatus Eisenbacteria bacterium]